MLGQHCWHPGNVKMAEEQLAQAWQALGMLPQQMFTAAVSFSSSVHDTDSSYRTHTSCHDSSGGRSTPCGAQIN